MIRSCFCTHLCQIRLHSLSRLAEVHPEPGKKLFTFLCSGGFSAPPHLSPHFLLFKQNCSHISAKSDCRCMKRFKVPAHPRCSTRMCLFMPTEDVRTLPQLGHRHLYTLLTELCGRKSTETCPNCRKAVLIIAASSVFPEQLCTFGFLAASSSPCSSSMCKPSSGLLSISVTDGEGAGLTLPWSQLQ